MKQGSEKTNIFMTDDGSNSLQHKVFNELYHSDRGAISESEHVYIRNGFNLIEKTHIKILELGFGTGLNFLVTLIAAQARNISFDYHTFELYPISIEIAEKLNFSKFCTEKQYELFISAHKAPFFSKIKLFENGHISKYSCDICEYRKIEPSLDLVYFDAFSPDTQPELWSKELFSEIYSKMNEGAILVTYSAKGLVKQNLRAANFNVKRVKGALGKHHMLIATK